MHAESIQEREEFIESLGADDDTTSEGADHGSDKEMSYPEYVEGVGRIAYNIYLNGLASDDEREEVRKGTVDPEVTVCAAHHHPQTACMRARALLSSAPIRRNGLPAGNRASAA